MLIDLLIVWVVQKEWDMKRADQAAQKARDDRAALAAEAEKKRAEVRSSTK
jgi:hypothetical protein